jgi:hypothetical protein
VLARVTPGTDVANLIESERVGAAYVGDSVEEFAARAARLMEDAAARAAMGQQGQALARRLFSPASAVRQIVAAVSKGGRRAKQARSIAGSPT